MYVSNNYFIEYIAMKTLILYSCSSFIVYDKSEKWKYAYTRKFLGQSLLSCIYTTKIYIFHILFAEKISHIALRQKLIHIEICFFIQDWRMLFGGHLCPHLSHWFLGSFQLMFQQQMMYFQKVIKMIIQLDFES